MTTSIVSQFEELSPQALALLHRMLDQQEPPDHIRRAIFRLSGERVQQQAITLYASHYAQRSNMHSEARSQTDNFIKLAGKRGVTISELLRARLIERLVELQRGKKPGDAALWKLVDAERRHREFRLRKLKAEREIAQKERALGFQERQLHVAEQKLEFAKQRLRKAVSHLEQKTRRGKSLSKDDIRRIRAVYGLGVDNPPDAQASGVSTTNSDNLTHELH